jgi:hypothetical protein
MRRAQLSWYRRAIPRRGQASSRKVGAVRSVLHDGQNGIRAVFSRPASDQGESWCTMLKIERIKPDRDRWTAELTFTPIAFDPDYWFNRSEGFLVDSPDRAVSVVDEVVRAANGDVALLAVVGGWFGRRRFPNSHARCRGDPARAAASSRTSCGSSSRATAPPTPFSLQSARAGDVPARGARTRSDEQAPKRRTLSRTRGLPAARDRPRPLSQRRCGA